jgi:cytochrome bd ubiquinol oxidase subunit I
MDVELLSRIQFAITIMFHYLFPPLTIGMGIVMVYLEAMFLKTREPIYETAARFWTQLFALSFAVGVATGIVMEFQFGTNWAAYSRFVGDVFGAALAAEGIFAFFLESGFLAVLVFGWDKVSPRFHFFATLMVALGSIFSAVWIIVANSWQQTPEGHHYVQVMRDGVPWFVDGLPVIRAEVADFWAVVFNPSTIDRLVHTIIGAFLMGSFFIMSISAYYLLRGKHLEFAKRSFTGALMLGTIFSLAQLASGHSNADMVAEYQPAKLAAFEGHFETGPADLSLLGLPDREQEKTLFSLGIPGGVSFLVDWDFDSQVLGLKAFPKEDWPPLVITFASYHIMIGLGTFFILITLVGSFYRWRGTLFEKRWLLRLFMGTVILAVAANQLGWVAAEVGRQPWVVQAPILYDDQGQPLLDENGLVTYETIDIDGMPPGVVMTAGMRTSDAVSESVGAGEVLGSIIMFSLIYLLLGGIWLYVLDHKIKVGPMPAPEQSPGAGTQEVNHGS